MIIKTLSAGLLLMSLGACSLAPGPYLDRDRLDQTVEPTYASLKYPVKPIDIAYFAQARAATQPSKCPLTCLTKEERNNYSYKVGINDQLTIIVWDHPELTGGGGGFGNSGGGNTPAPLPQGNAGNSAALSPGSGGITSSVGGVEGGLVVRVANNGTIFFPRVGRVKVLGMTAEQIQQVLTQRISKEIKNPQLDVRVSGFNSQVIQMTGNVRSPAAESITDLPLSVVDAINRAGGALADADLQNVGITRDGKRYLVDVAALLETGDPQQNVILQDGDIVDVPDRSNSRVFVLGEVVRPTSLPMNRGKLSLADALTGANGIDVKTGDPRFIYVVRGAFNPALAPITQPAGVVPVSAKPNLKDSALVPLVYRLDMTQVDAIMLMTRFELQPRDVVYVQVASSARFNRFLEQLTPTIQTIFFTKELVHP
ncbi:MAG: sugar transporter [Paraburkholderia sp.]|uniref:polysaccharide biosynthesis/export family protein n=1 Tax=Paraburkholderia sp. TaxID=1926495 RepID=UPI001205BF35|nr:polysaccharide biosynthesis/export family protein [Paraburkholderia sp.]TAL95341.1 MAG: sugar transporter [Paraburkholderia sp.]